jgi:hypothetical protein
MATLHWQPLASIISPIDGKCTLRVTALQVIMRFRYDQMVPSPPTMVALFAKADWLHR